MATKDEQTTLDRILAELKSGETDRCLQALEELGTLKFSSPAILRELEKLAIHHRTKEVRISATQLLGSSVHQYVRGSLNKLNRGDRAFVLKQLDLWEADELLSTHVADVIRARYNFDIAAPQVEVPKAAAVSEKVRPRPLSPRGLRSFPVRVPLLPRAYSVKPASGSICILARSL